MATKEKSVLKIFFEGVKIYTLNIHKFLLYMLFPVFGQLFGLFLIFGTTFWFTQNYQNLVIKYPFLNEMSTMLTCIIAMVIPGLLIFIKALWDFLIAYGAINSMTEGYLNTGRVYDFKAHSDIVLKKTFSFITIWMLIGICTIIAIIPVFWIFAFIFFVYFILVFQVFTFENGLSPFGYFKRSFELIKGKFARTVLLMSVLGLITYYILPAGLSVIFDYLNLTNILSKAFEAWAFTLPLETVEQFGITPAVVGENILKQMIFFIMLGFTLPLRSICFTLWYNNFAEPVEVKKTKRKTIKKAVKTKKLPENFKIEKRGIDPEIIRRARLEDDEY